MSVLDDLKPRERFLVMDLVAKAAVDVSAWADTKGAPAANPKYCYNWSFEQPGELVVVCLWHNDLEVRGSTVVHASKRRNLHPRHVLPGRAVWLRRAQAFDRSVESAYRQQLPVRVIVVNGAKRDFPKEAGASIVEARLLDDVAWAVTEYDYDTGERLLVRGATPVRPQTLASPDLELSWFEGAERRKFILHRQREGRARREKIKDALAKNGGCLICEVKKCRFDFKRQYGDLGEGYAQVHHLKPLSDSPIGGREVNLKDLVIVCANCHAMIHLGGKCRSLKDLIP